MKKTKVLFALNNDAPLIRRGTVKKIQGISSPGEEVEYIYDDEVNRLRNVQCSPVEEEERDCIYEDTVGDIQGISPPGEEVEYIYDDEVNRLRNVQCSPAEEEERDCIYEDTVREIQGISSPSTEEAKDICDGQINELNSAQHSEAEAPKRGPDHKEDSDTVRSRINPEKMIPEDEICNYLMAKEIIWKYGLKRLSILGTTIWCFNGKSYVPLDDQKLGELIYSEIPEAAKLEVSSCTGIKKNVIAFIRDELAQAVKQGDRRFYFNREDYKGIMGKVVLKNGVFDIRSGLLEKFDAKKPYYYELDATYLEIHDDRLDTPAFDKLISDACGGDRESVQMIMQVFGMLLTPNPCKKFPVVGPASNSGKSVLFGGFLEEILPRSRISHIATSELKDKFALGNAENLLLITCMDVDMNTISPAVAGVIKRATGEEVITVQDKYKPQKDIEVRFKFVFGTNGAFCTQQRDKGWQNRILAVPFIHETPEEEMDMHLLDKLLEEKDAIVTKVLRAMETVITAKGDLRVKESELSIKLKNGWTTYNAFFDEFMSEMVKVTGEEEDNYSTDELFEAYCQYYIRSVRLNCEHRNNKQLSRDEFVSNVLEYGSGLIKKKRMKQSRKEHFKNAQHRLCGLLLKDADILDTDDMHESENYTA